MAKITVHGGPSLPPVLAPPEVSPSASGAEDAKPEVEVVAPKPKPRSRAKAPAAKAPAKKPPAKGKAK